MSTLTKQQAIAKLDELAGLVNSGKRQDAIAQFNRVSDLMPDDVDVAIQIGNFCVLVGELTKAKEIFSRIVDKYPDNAIYLTVLGKIYRSTNEFGEAAVLLHKAVDIKPDLVSAMVELSSIYYELHHYEEAASMMKRAIKLQPKDAELLANLALCLTLQKQYKEAIKLGEKSLKLNRDLPNTYMTLGLAYSECGSLDKAIACYEKVIKKDKQTGAAYLQLSKLKKFTEADRAFIDSTEKLLSESLTPQARSDVHFALGKVYDDLKQWNKAFEHYRKGNLLGKSRFADAYLESAMYGKQSHRHFLKLSKKIFTRQLLSSGLAGSDSTTPVFVVGMPRSGSTLIEQIISSHPKANAAGELQDFGNLMMSVSKPDDETKFRDSWEKTLNHEKLLALAEVYLSSLTRERGEALRIVDKMPDNYIFIGAITLMFPNARIINTVRNPVDTCLSCYFQQFNDVGWSYDMKQIAEHYTTYREAIDYWKSVLPAGRIYDAHYEQLIADPETQTRKLIDACGLEWDSACLNHQDLNRTISTASLWQARQPIYKSSVRRWENYASHIGDLLQGILKYLDDDDRRIMKEHGMKPQSWLKRMFS